jgi:transcriptional regulator with XRE-family HTH domain
MQLALALRKARMAAGMSQEHVAFEAGISVRHYNDLESGGLNPGYLTLRRVVSALDSTVAEIVRSADRQKIPASRGRGVT